MLPLRNAALGIEQAAYVPGQQSEAEAPEEGQEGVDVKAQARLEVSFVVEVGGDDNRDVGAR